jgi:hypothetical protein
MKLEIFTVKLGQDIEEINKCWKVLIYGTLPC